ncbi:MAG TPA: Gfo/Idh/MocA family oxidoreductase [Clostridia bacterium]|nr:Gfo/Idh/MocA family oxidoreductase [Clostridia bacterium]
MSAKIKWGVIGCGGIAARRTIPEFKKMVSNAELVSVMDVNATRAQEVAKQFSVPHWCATEEELLAQDLQAVYIATPQNAHARQTVQAALAGKHVLCEKPIAITTQEVDDMAAACARKGVKFMLAWCMRQNVYNKKMRELVQSGALGKMVMGRAQLTCWYPPIPGAWRQDATISHGGALIDMGTHCLDLLEWIMDSEIAEVTGFQDLLVHKYPTKIEDTSTIVVRFKNGAHGIVDNYFNVPDAAAQNALELFGTKGSAIARGTIGQDPTGEMFSILQPDELGYSANQERNVNVKREEYKFDGMGIYGQMITLFTECILQNAEPPASFASGRHSVQVVEAIYRAARERKVVEVSKI